MARSQGNAVALRLPLHGCSIDVLTKKKEKEILPTTKLIQIDIYYDNIKRIYNINTFVNM
jgi:hypothetical protein